MSEDDITCHLVLAICTLRDSYPNMNLGRIAPGLISIYLCDYGVRVIQSNGTRSVLRSSHLPASGQSVLPSHVP